ncbi:uroporphyrinogen decarboxylase [Terrilactibacillus tamarindi]|uniref:uroporphyrinogen decarboxylase n=1 Tax=Terrilactibacillus tamarindi TaxID=2599694 RepID=UPI0012BD04AD
MLKVKKNDVLLKACLKEPVPYVPVWYMRQAGRYQPEYRAIRQKYSFFEISHNPEICAEVTKLPVTQLGVDAAILFADIMTPLKSIGINVDIVEGIGPVIENPIRSEKDLEGIRLLNPGNDIPFVQETIKILRDKLDVPLIGFAGAPFTLASYLIEGGPSKGYHITKGFMYSKPHLWQNLMARLSDLTISYLEAQIEAGAQIVQVFDSWVGALNSEDYHQYIAPFMHYIFSELKKTGVPTIYFASGATHLLKEWNELPVDVISLDWRTTIEEVRNQHIDKALQGNLDPSLLLAPFDLIKKRTKAILDQGKDKPGFIFNLGHGIFPSVKVDTLKKLTDYIHQYTRKDPVND